MASDPGVAFALVLDGVVLLAAVAAYSYWYWTRGDAPATQRPSAAEWYATAATLARELQREADVRAGADRDAVRRRLLPLSHRLRGHVRRAPPEVEERAVRLAYTLSTDCYRLAVEHTVREASRTGVFIEDELADVAASAATLEAIADAADAP